MCVKIKGKIYKSLMILFNSCTLLHWNYFYYEKIKNKKLTQNRFHWKWPHTITKIYNNINIDNTINAHSYLLAKKVESVDFRPLFWEQLICLTDLISISHCKSWQNIPNIQNNEILYWSKWNSLFVILSSLKISSLI